MRNFSITYGNVFLFVLVRVIVIDFFRSITITSTATLSTSRIILHP